ncbi:P-loop NTPase family protein [Spongiimicrobium salis]|uniref:hypothetical protein n=1 Tax=Spongiimicrobium salis TaxID=1667022 RepID=UPI00374D9511
MAKSATEAIQNFKNRIDPSNKQLVFENPHKGKEPVKEYVLTNKDFDFLFDGFSKLVLQEKGKGEEFISNTIIETVKQYFLGNLDFDQHGLVLSNANIFKGIMLYGDYGVGKSVLFEIFHRMGRELSIKRNCNQLWFRSVTAPWLVESYMRAADAKKKGNASNSFDIKNYYKGALYIDDLGFEKKAFNSTELLGELLFERHRRGAITHVSTNKSSSELTERYGDRIGDRIPEMFNIIKWNGESLRES